MLQGLPRKVLLQAGGPVRGVGAVDGLRAREGEGGNDERVRLREVMPRLEDGPRATGCGEGRAPRAPG